MFTPTTPYIKPLGNNLTLKSLSTHDDVERLGAFNTAIHGNLLDATTRELILHHPHTRPEHWLFVEDESAHKIVSTLCLIPWTWRYEDVELKAGEMGIVGTHEDYRGRGLIRALDERFKTLLHEGSYDLSQIQGIPYFYRQFGYEYAIPLEGGFRLELHTVPEETAPFRFRPATVDDIPTLMQFYDDAARDLTISATRDADVWRYLLEHAVATDTARDMWLVLDANESPVGYWAIERYGFGEGLNVCEASRLSHAAAVAVLCKCKALAADRARPYIRLNMAAGSTLVRAAHMCDPHDLGTYAWQIYVPDLARLLRKLAPVFERRIAASPFAGLTRTICLNLYREAFDLRFEGGKLIDVNAIGFSPEGDMRIPPRQFVPLVLGYRSREELRTMFPDVSIWGEARLLADVLFPKVEAFIYTNY